MHVGELLLLMADIRPNVPIFFDQKGKPIPVTEISWTKSNVETPAALFHLDPTGHPRRQWELTALLKEANRPTDQINVITKEGPVLIFGFRLVNKHIWLG
ncbi:hypothetical protein [Schleiferilactobacillus perolens]|uniref:Uncharacterized protein n=1 Tax=Schleiferilactobacillus perolens DSM 12744 TaxID=1423792 RepID=A0A0R1N8W9_9LACO|nr:hypothetical protein [Schleiferilactobacillus perolens]KRL13355.1 hypothetical protein FD09_GL002184 [Schleiferilactobacillus perolens DSM 12744]